MNAHTPKLLLLFCLVSAAILASCSRDEPTIVAPVVVIVPGEMKMNEIYSRGVVGNLDWIELYNPSSLPINIGGYNIYDVGGQGGTKPKKTIPAGTTVPGGGFYVVVTDTNSSASVLDGFGLSSAGEKVWLENATGALIDTVSFPAMLDTQTYGRYPNGDSTWQLLNTITRGASNKQ